MIGPGIYKVMVDAKSDSGEYIAEDMEDASRKFYRVRFAFVDESLLFPPKERTPALLARISSGENFVFAYFNLRKDLENTQVSLIGDEKVFRIGESRALILFPSGILGIYDTEIKENGTLALITNIQYGVIKDNIYHNDLRVNASALNVSILGAGDGSNLSVGRDDIGNFVYRLAAKNNLSDTSCRTEWLLENTPTGPLLTFKMDLLPIPQTAVPKSLQFPKNLTMTMKMGSQSATGPCLELAVNDLLKFEIGMLGDVSFETLKGMVKFAIDNKGEVNLSNASGAGKVTMLPTGKIEISGSTGLDLIGKQISLLKTIADYIEQDAGHTHIAPSGTTSPPIQQPAYKQAQLKVKTIKG